MTLYILLLILQTPSPTPTITPTPAPTPQMTTYEQINVALTLTTAILGLLALLLWWMTLRAGRKRGAAERLLHETQAKLARAEQKVSRMQEHAHATPVVEYLFHDIVLLGPKDSGKTCVAELWTRPWYNIDQPKASRKFETYEANIFEFKPDTKRRHEVYEVERTYKKALRVRIHDYPGDDDYKVQALEKLPELENAALILFFDLLYGAGGVSPTPIDKNNSYYSQYFLTKLGQQPKIVNNLSKVIVVFNKVDLLPQGMSEAEMKAMLLNANADAVNRIESAFGGNTDYRLLSTRDNRGAISLLGFAGSLGLSKENKARYDRQIEKLFKNHAKYSDVESDGDESGDGAGG